MDIAVVIIAAVMAWDGVLTNWITILISWFLSYLIPEVVVVAVERVTFLILKIHWHVLASWRSVKELATRGFLNILDNQTLLHCLLTALNDIVRDICWRNINFAERRMASAVEITVRRRTCLIGLKWRLIIAKVNAIILWIRTIFFIS